MSNYVTKEVTIKEVKSYKILHKSDNGSSHVYKHFSYWVEDLNGDIWLYWYCEPIDKRYKALYRGAYKEGSKDTDIIDIAKGEAFTNYRVILK